MRAQKHNGDCRRKKRKKRKKAGWKKHLAARAAAEAAELAAGMAARKNKGAVVVDADDEAELRSLVEEHRLHTNSAKAKRVMETWDEMLPKFDKVYPRDYRRVLEARKRDELEAVSNG